MSLRGRVHEVSTAEVAFGVLPPACALERSWAVNGEQFASFRLFNLHHDAEVMHSGNEFGRLLGVVVITPTKADHGTGPE